MTKKLTKEEQALQDRLQAALALHGYQKVRLMGTSHFAGESVWAVPADAESKRKIEDDGSHGEKVILYLANQPVFWNANKKWGELIYAHTDGQNRPFARAEDNA